MDAILNNINGIMGITLGGVSLATIIGMIIALVRSFVSFRKENKLTEEYIEKAFKNVILPSTIKLDLSQKIEQPLKQGFTEIQNCLSETLAHVQRGEKLILSILNEFTHVQKLPEETRKEIEAYVNEGKTMTVTLED